MPYDILDLKYWALKHTDTFLVDQNLLQVGALFSAFPRNDFEFSSQVRHTNFIQNKIVVSTNSKIG